MIFKKIKKESKFGLLKGEWASILVCILWSIIGLSFVAYGFLFFEGLLEAVFMALVGVLTVSMAVTFLTDKLEAGVDWREIYIEELKRENKILRETEKVLEKRKEVLTK